HVHRDGLRRSVLPPCLSAAHPPPCAPASSRPRPVSTPLPGGDGPPPQTTRTAHLPMTPAPALFLVPPSAGAGPPLDRRSTPAALRRCPAHLPRGRRGDHLSRIAEHRARQRAHECGRPAQ